MSKKIIKKVILAILILLALVFTFQMPVEAAGFTASAKNNLITGESTTFTLSATECTGKFTITSSDTSVISISGTTSQWIEGGGNHSVTLKANKAGKATVSVQAEDVSDSAGNPITGSKSVTITVKDPAPTNNGGGNSGSSNANLKSITVAGKTYNNPNRDITVTVDSKTNSTEVSAQTSDANAKVSGTGRKELSTGTNTVVLKVTAQNGNTQEYTIRIRKLAEENNVPNRTNGENNNNNDDNNNVEPDIEQPDENQEQENLRLSYLLIEGVEISPIFDSDVFEYTASVTNIDSLDIIANANIDDATVEITGDKELIDGENEIFIKLKKDEEETEYKIVVTKTTITPNTIEENNIEEEISFWQKNKILIITGGIILLIAIGILIYVLRAKSRDDMGYRPKRDKGRHSSYDDFDD